MAKKNEKTDKRRRRDYVGEVIEEEKENREKKEQEQTKTGKRKGLFDNLLEKPEKQVPIYLCPGCPQPEDPEQAIAFKTVEELQGHLEEVHGIKMIPEDIERCAKEVNKSLAEKVFKGMKDVELKLRAEEEAQQKRFEAALQTPKDQEPEQIITEGEAKDPNQVYSKVIERTVSPKSIEKIKPAEDEYYSENIESGIIEIAMFKRFPINSQVLAALQVLKMNM